MVVTYNNPVRLPLNFNVRAQMRVVIRIARIVALLILVVVVPLSVASVGSRYTGDRVYLLNSTRCRIVVMEQHDGHGANPGAEVLIKHGFVDRTPTMMIVSGSAIWLGGLHFSIDKLQVRDVADIAIPSSWLGSSITGRTLTYELTADGQLLVKAPPAYPASQQPQGLPLKVRQTADSNECIRS